MPTRPEILAGSARDDAFVVRNGAPLNGGPCERAFISRVGDYGASGPTEQIDRTDYVRADFKPL